MELGNAPLARTYTSEGLQPDSARVSETGTAKAAEGAEKSKRKGRFQIVEEDAADPAKQNRVGRSTSVASMDTHRANQVSQLFATTYNWVYALCYFSFVKCEMQPALLCDTVFN